MFIKNEDETCSSYVFKIKDLSLTSEILEILIKMCAEFRRKVVSGLQVLPVWSRLTNARLGSWLSRDIGARHSLSATKVTPSKVKR